MKIPVPGININLPIKPSREYESRLYREQSPFRMFAIPVASVMLASMLTAMPVLEDQALLPPFGFLIFLGWRLLQPGLWPMWAGLPFGLFDDIFSGQPFGSAGLLWSLMMIAIQLIDVRAVWRDHWQDWLIAAVTIIIALFMGHWIVGLAFTKPGAVTLMPQIMLSVLLFPLVIRFCARLDRIRLAT
jgi:rod shape-determining protein MreD